MEINRLHVDFDLQSKYDPKGDQINAIAELTEGLNNGEKYQTLLGATGTGKTFAAAFAMKNINAKRILFIVHREQIARQALETFKIIFGNSRTYGLLTGENK